jgi:cytoskeletal protein CcmA (bactofilin family)
MPYTFTITEVVNNIAVNTTATNIAVTLDNINFVVTSTNQVVNLTRAYNTVTIYENAVELKLSNLNTFWRGTWATGTSYYNGDFVDYQYSTYLLKDVYLNSDVPYNSNTIPPSDSNWQRIQWHEAPFAYLTVTNAAIIGGQLTAGSASVNGNLNSVNLTVSGGSVLTGARVNGVLTATSISSPSATITDLSVTNSLTAGNIGSNGTLTVNGGVRITGYTTITNTLKVDSITIGNSSDTGALNIKGNANIDGILTANTLTISQRSNFNGPVYINDSLNFNAGSSLTVPNLTVSNQFITGGLRYPTYTGEYGQVLFTNGSTGTAWVNLGDLVFWELSADLLTNGYKIISGGANTDLILGLGTSTSVTNRIKLTSTGTNIYGDLLPNNIKFPDGSNQTTAYLGIASVSQVGGIKKSSTDNSYNIDGNGVLTISTANIINSFIVPYAALGRTGGFREGGSYYYVDDSTGYLVLDGTNLVKDNLPTATQTAYGAVKIGNGTDQYYVYLDGSGKARIPAIDYAGTDKWGIIKVGDYLSITGDGILSVNTTSISSAVLVPATTTSLGAVRVGSGLSVTSTGTISVNTATAGRTGSIQVGNFLTIDSNAVLSINTTTLGQAIGSSSLTTATATQLGGIRVGDYLSINSNAVLTVNTTTLAPVLVAIGLTTATTSVLGGIKVGSHLNSRGDGTLDADYPSTAEYVGGTPGLITIDSGSFRLQPNGALYLNTATNNTVGGIRISLDDWFTMNEQYLNLKTDPLIDYYKTANRNFATTSSYGFVQVNSSSYITVTNGVLDLNTASLYQRLIPDATTSTKGLVTIGNNINVSSGTISVATGSTSTLGLVKLGPGLSLDSNGAVIPDYSYTGTLRLSVQKVYIGTDVYHSTLYVERIESFDENGSVFFPGGVKFPDNTTQITAYPGDFGVLGP